MENLVILRLHNEIEAHVITSILDQVPIPYQIRSFHDSAIDNETKKLLGWGQIETDMQYANSINELVNDLDTEF